MLIHSSALRLGLVCIHLRDVLTLDGFDFLPPKRDRNFISSLQGCRQQMLLPWRVTKFQKHLFIFRQSIHRTTE